MRSGRWPVLKRDRLRIAIEQVREVEVPVCSSQLHLWICITQVGVPPLAKCFCFGIVSHDDNHLHTAIFIIGGKLFDSLFVHLRYGAMIAIKNNHQHFARCVILGRVVLPVHAEKMKIRRMRADLKDRGNVVW